jgi:HK97 family phage prohead protease
MTPRVETKSFELEIKDADSSGMIRGYASTFGNIDQGLDVVDKGAFKKSIKESKGLFPILADHNPTKQIGWNLRAEEDDKGLYVEGKLDLNVQDAREKYSLAKTAMENGAKMGLSIGYMTIKAEPDRQQTSIRRLKELKLFEYSIVTFPMNTSAMITAMKSDFQSMQSIDSLKKLIAELKQNGITHSDLLLALQDDGAADYKDDPSLAQSLSQLIASMRA